MTSNIENWWNKQYPPFIGRELPMHRAARKFIQDAVLPVAVAQLKEHGLGSDRHLLDLLTTGSVLRNMRRAAQLQLSFGVLGSSYEMRSAEHSTVTLPGHNNIEIIWEFLQQFPDIKRKIADLNDQDQVTIIFYGGLNYMDVWHQMNVTPGRYLDGEPMRGNADGFILRKFRHEFDSEEA